MSKFDYYKAPSDEVFADIKATAIKIWRGYDDTYGYATEKTDRIKDIQNVRDNTCYIIAMFDRDNQKRLFNMVELEDSKKFLSDLWEEEAKSLFEVLLENKD